MQSKDLEDALTRLNDYLRKADEGNRRMCVALKDTRKCIRNMEDATELY